MLYDVDLEQAVIGAAMNSTKALEAVLELRAEDFETSRGRVMLAAMQRMQADEVSVDLVTLDTYTGGKHTSWLIDAGSTLAHNHANYIAALRDRAKRRAIAAAAQKLMNRAVDITADMDDATVELVSDLKKLTTGTSRTVTAFEGASALMDSFDARSDQRAYFGVGRLDETLGGLFGGKLVVVGARPATGKSALALSAALATQTHGAVLFCSYEMAPVEIMGRAMAGMTGVSARKIANREVDMDDLQALVRKFPEASSLDIHITTTANTPAKVRTEALRLGKERGLALIVVDYLQLMSSGQRSESRRVEVGQISRALKQMALELDVPVLALSQLNRQSEQTATKEPTMAELRESGDLEQDADVIVLMHAPPAEMDHVRGIKALGHTCIRLILEKNRQGPSGQRFDVVFDGARMTFKKVSTVLGKEPKL